MTYAELKQAEAEYSKALETPKKQRGATKAQLAYRSRRLALCVNCGEPFASHAAERTEKMIAERKAGVRR